jgi:hypothetical protein
MKKIYNYFINYDKHIKNRNEIVSPEIENSLKQGNALLKSRRKFLNDLEYNLIHYNKNIVEGFKEGNTNPDLSGFSTDDAKLISEKIAEFKRKKSEYNTKLQKYETDYSSFIKEFNELKKKVQTCKTTCTETHNSNTEKSKQNACLAGCHLKGPYIKEAENTFIDNDTESKYSCPTSASNCNDTNMNVKTDSKGTSILKGCTICGGGKFGKPKYVLNGSFIQNCNHFQNNNESELCRNAAGPETIKIRGLVTKYAALSTINQHLLTLADEILEIVKTLKVYNINLINDKTTLLTDYQENSVSYKSIQDEINRFTKKNKLTLDMKVSDNMLKKNAYDLRIYIWLILALGLGFAALNKIRRF